MRILRGSNSAAVIARLNPIIKGWAAYYRGVVSSKVFHTLDYQMWKLTYKWATWHHNNKPKQWIVDHYFGKRNKFRNDRWVFGDPGSDAYLIKFSWTDIVRHVMVQGAASPDDPALADYWAKRRRKVKPPLDNYTLRLLARQDARCPICGTDALAAITDALTTATGARIPGQRFPTGVPTPCCRPYSAPQRLHQQRPGHLHRRVTRTRSRHRHRRADHL
jgi:RNA-directed DNA polymerase